MSADHGLESLKSRSLVDTLWRRRTHRVSRGSDVAAGEMSYKSRNSRAPLSALEEAVLIAATGCTGLSMPDRPFFDPRNGKPIMAKPNVNMVGRTAGSPDNAQGTHFFMINDSGTYFLRKLPPADGDPFDADLLLKRAEMAKVKLLDRRIDVEDRDFPAYLDSNRFLSNLPGTTVFFPVVDLSHQYINGMMYLLTQPEGARPTIVDDRNFYRKAGVKKWVNNGFLNKKLKVPLGVIWSMRTQIEADLLIQNQFLVAEAMGLGAWIHGSMSPPVLMGDPKYIKQYGPMLGFKFVTPRWRFLDAFRWGVWFPTFANVRANPVGLTHNGEPLIKGSCPPNFPSMSAAVDDVIAAKFGPNGIYSNPATFDQIYREKFGETYLKVAQAYPKDVIDCTRDICTYIYETHGRFPAHVDAIQAPGIWLQIHHVEQEYYDTYFQHGLTQVHRDHDKTWHGAA
jgi:hypothetical protein